MSELSPGPELKQRAVPLKEGLVLRDANGPLIAGNRVGRTAYKGRMALSDAVC